LACETGSTDEKDTNFTLDSLLPARNTSNPSLHVVPVLLSTVDAISHLRIHLPKDLRPLSSRETAWKAVREIQKRWPKSVPLLDPISNMGIKDPGFLNLVKVRFNAISTKVAKLIHHEQKMEVLNERIEHHVLANDPKLPEYYELYARKQDSHTRLKNLRKNVQSARDIMQLEELKCRKRVLRRMSFASGDDVVEMKGRVACEISSGDELLLTEMIFEGVFNTLSPEQSAALLSCFVFAEKVSLIHTTKATR
jgi:ATP-dependent RNA helicase DOB1